MAALDRAVALAEVDDVAVRVGEHLHLDVPRILEVALDVDAAVREVLLALALRRLERPLGLARLGDELHALAAAARGRLDDQRIADLLAERAAPPRRVSTGSVVPGMIGTPASPHRRPRPRLRAHQLDRLARRADPDEPGVLDRPREAGVLGEEAVAGMDRLGARALRGLDDALADEVALRGRAGADQERLVRRPARAAPRGRPRSRRRPMPMPSSRSVRKIRIAISPRFATRTFEKSGMSGVFSPSHERFPTS